jgi:hypothetical protein
MTQAAEETLKRLRGESRKHLRDIAATARRRAEQDMSTSNDFTGHQASDEIKASRLEDVARTGRHQGHTGTLAAQFYAG